MVSKQIEKTLSALKAESSSIVSKDADSAETINQLIGELERQLSEPDISDHQGLTDQLQSAIDRIEMNHPTITSTLNDLMVKLASLGV